MQDNGRTGKVMKQRDFTSAKAKESILNDSLDSLNPREYVKVPEIDVDMLSEDPANMEEERCCGNCCWFCFEDTDGWGQCMVQDIETNSMHCSDMCEDNFVSRQEMRHHMVVLLKEKRWQKHTEGWRNGEIYFPPRSKEILKAIDFAYKYMKVFGKL